VDFISAGLGFSLEQAVERMSAAASNAVSELYSLRRLLWPTVPPITHSPEFTKSL
jgi:hypothetical protein